MANDEINKIVVVDPVVVTPPGAHQQRLFEHMYNQHGLILLHTELDDIVRIVEEEY